jgi:serine-type D-Ala-D-Ala carboxypeptidase/endopeptidase (penicillin-binding protein 4)
VRQDASTSFKESQMRMSTARHVRWSRRRLAASTAAVVSVLAVTACSGGLTTGASSSKGRALPTGARAIVDSAPYAHGSWNYDAVDLDSGKTLYAQNENQLNFLGSTTKLFTVGTYYDEVGADATLQTPVYATGQRSGTNLGGNLVLVGSGDFILGSRGVLNGELEWTEPDHVYAYASPPVKPVAANPLAGLDRLAAEVKASGISSVSGDVLVDDRLFDAYETKEGVLTSVMVNDNLLDILVNAGSAAGQPVTVGTIPATGYFSVVNHATTSAAGGQSTLSASLAPDNTVTITGQLPVGSPQQDLAQFAPSPAGYARALFIEALRRAGVTVTADLKTPTGTLPTDSAYRDADKVASLTSPPASVLTKLVTEISHNRGAETLMCLLALKAGSKDCSTGMSTIVATVAKAGLQPGTVEIYDGEGSDPSSATPAAMIAWLSWLRSQPFGAQLREGLPDINHDGSILVKSGLSARPELGPQPALFVAAGQAGYVTTAKGKDVAVALYALNATYPSVADGLLKDLPATEQVLREIQQAN